MPSVYFEYSGNVTPGSTIRSNKYNNDQVAIDTAFEFVEKDMAMNLSVGGVRTRAQNTIPSPEADSLIMIGPESTSLFPLATLIDISSKLDNAPQQIEAMAEFSSILQQAETGWIDIKNDAIAPKNRKVQAHCITEDINVTLEAMTVNDALVLRNNKESSYLLRVINTSHVIRGNKGNLGAGKNLVLKPGVTLSFLCVNNNELEILQ